VRYPACGAVELNNALKDNQRRLHLEKKEFQAPNYKKQTISKFQAPMTQTSFGLLVGIACLIINANQKMLCY
jgi:hypothetical protein